MYVDNRQTEAVVVKEISSCDKTFVVLCHCSSGWAESIVLTESLNFAGKWRQMTGTEYVWLSEGRRKKEQNILTYCLP